MHYHHIVIGAGSMGMAAGYQLAKGGGKTLLLDSFSPPHDNGSHHGETRLIRYAYGEGLEYVPFALRAGALWRELQQATNKKIFHETGVLNAGAKETPFVQNVMASAQKFKLPLEVFSAAEVKEKWPGIQLPENYLGCYEPTAGVLQAENCIAAYRESALKEGAEIRTNSRVVTIDAQADKITVKTLDGAAFTADSIVLSVGAWAADLLKQLNLNLPLNPVRKTFAWYEADEELYNENNLPGFAIQAEDAFYYGFPSIDAAGLKVGRHDGGIPINPDEERMAFGKSPEDTGDLNSFIHTYMPSAGQLKYGKTCMYTMTPDEDFIIDLHPTHKNIAIAAGFSGHGFKFASAVGEALSQLIINGSTELDLTPFAINRFINK